MNSLFEAAEDALALCEAGGGDWSSEEDDYDAAENAVIDAGEALDEASEEPEDAGETYEECMDEES